MEVSIKIENLDEVQRFLKSRPVAIKNELNRAVKKTVVLIEREAKKRTPVDTGRLRTSIRSKTSGDKGEVYTNVKYAVVVHENLRARHRTGEAKYLERAFKQSIPKIKSFFESGFKKVLKP